MTRRTVCLDAHEILIAREAAYGPMATSWEEVAELAALLATPDDTPGQRAVLVLVATKLVRRKHSPANPDHLRDACGYLGILAEQEAQRNEGEVDEPAAAPAANDVPWAGRPAAREG